MRACLKSDISPAVYPGKSTENLRGTLPTQAEPPERRPGREGLLRQGTTALDVVQAPQSCLKNVPSLKADRFVSLGFKRIGIQLGLMPPSVWCGLEVNYFCLTLRLILVLPQSQRRDSMASRSGTM